LDHVARGSNKIADALINLVATLALGAKENIKDLICKQWVITLPNDDGEEEVKIFSACAVDKEYWCQPLINYMKYGKLPSDVRHKTKIQRRASHFLYYKGTLYRRFFLGLWLRCLEEEEKQVMEEAHAGVCNVPQSGPKLHDRIKRMANTSPPWCVIVLTMQKGVIHVSFMLTSFTSTQSHSIQP